MLVAGVSGFLVARESYPGATARAEPPPGQASWPTPRPGERVCGKTFGPNGEVDSYCLPGTPPAPFWYVPVAEEDRVKPRFDQVINGIRIGPTVRRSSDPRCRNDSPEPSLRPRYVPAQEAAGTPLEVNARYLPYKTDFVEALALKCVGEILSVEHEYYVRPDPSAMRYGGYLGIFRYRGEHNVELYEAAERMAAGSIKGRPAVLVRPITSDGYGYSAIAIAEPFGITLLQAGGITLAELIKIAESLY